MRRGQALVELALALSFLLLVLVGLADYGRALIIQVAMTNAAREGAFYAAANPDDLNGTRTRVKQEASNAGMTLSDSDITVQLPQNRQAGQPVTVTVQTSVPTLLSRFIGVNAIPVTAQATVPLLRR